MKKFDGILLGCDMDGTLLDSRKRISERNLDAIRYFTENGGLFSLATGRAPHAIDDYRDMLPFNAPYTHLNGSLIMSAEQKTLWCSGMPEITDELIENALSNFSQIGCEIFQDHSIYVRRMSAATEHHMQVLNLSYEIVSPDELPSMSSWCKVNLTGPETLMPEVREYLRRYEDKFCVAASTPNFCEITAAGVNKGSSLLKIADACGVVRKNILAIGDSSNDHSMLRVAGTAFVPENADSETKKFADVIVQDNNHNAVAAVVEWLDKQ